MHSSNPIDTLKSYLTSFDILTSDEIEEFVKHAMHKPVRKSEYFIKEGETCKRVAFVLSGTFRSYYISDKNEEITYCITFPNNLMTAYSSFLTSLPTLENIQAITDTELLVIPKSKIEALADHSQNWTLFLKAIAEQQYIELEKRIFQLQRSDAAKRYSDLLRDQPEYIRKIPLQYIASYLGITQRHLSRIRKSLPFRQLS